jgi:hypothetical protein
MSSKPTQHKIHGSNLKPRRLRPRPALRWAREECSFLNRNARPLVQEAEEEREVMVQVEQVVKEGQEVAGEGDGFMSVI